MYQNCGLRIVDWNSAINNRQSAISLTHPLPRGGTDLFHLYPPLFCESECESFLVRNVYSHAQQGGRKGLPLRVSHQRECATSTQTFVQKKVERFQVR